MGLDVDAETGAPLTAEEITALLPPGTPVVTWSSRSVRAQTPAGTGHVSWVETERADPMSTGRYTVSDGRAPEGSGEVAVTPALLERLGAGLGSEVELVDPGGRYEIVGVIEEHAAPRTQAVFATPGTLPPVDDLHMGSTSRVLAGGADPLTWEEVVALNEQGVAGFVPGVAFIPPCRPSS